MERGDLRLYCSCGAVVDARYDAESDQSLTEVILDALSEAAGVDPLELPPLYEFVDPDALGSLVEIHDEKPNVDAVVGFRIETWNVFVRADGRIRVCDGTQPTDPKPVFASLPL